MLDAFSHQNTIIRHFTAILEKMPLLLKIEQKMITAVKSQKVRNLYANYQEIGRRNNKNYSNSFFFSIEEKSIVVRTPSAFLKSISWISEGSSKKFPHKDSSSLHF